MKKLFYGLDRIYDDQMKLPVNRRQKWFYIIGCDTFVINDHLLKRLDHLGRQQAILLGGHWVTHVCLGPKARTGKADFPSGSAGIFFSVKLLKMMQPYLINYVENIWPKTSDLSAVRSCLFNQAARC